MPYTNYDEESSEMDSDSSLSSSPDSPDYELTSSEPTDDLSSASDAANTGRRRRSPSEATVPSKRRRYGLSEESEKPVEMSDIDVIQSWLQVCNASHGRHCQGLKRGGIHWPTWLVDVKNWCIVRGDETDRYCALSYVWGRVPSLQALQGNIERLQQPGSLREGQKIPNTIADTMNLVNLIGERYLWVDQLCIVQDDTETKRTQIQNMASIYANAYVTIVAARGNSAESRLPSRGDFNHKRPMHYGRDTQSHWQLLKRSKWNTRGWTFQEMIFSQRAIFFFADTITWDCHCARWTRNADISTQHVSACRNRFSHNSQGFHYTSWPDLAEYSLLVRLYNKRKLSRYTDALQAFAGVTSTLSRTFKDGFVYGHPALFFDISLLWQPSGYLQRRDEWTPSVTDEEYLPTWSWTGWRGKLDLSLWAGAYDYVYKRQVGTNAIHKWPTTSLKITPTVQWYSIIEKNERILIQNDGHMFRHLLDDFAGEIPAGWQRRPEQASGGAHRGYIYTHSTDTNTTFNYPVPIVNPAEPSSAIIQSPLIGCQTDRARLTFGDDMEVDADYLCVTLVDTNTKWAGILRIDLPPSRGYWWRPRHKAGDQCELVAISLGSVDGTQDESEILEEWPLLQEQGSSAPYEFYNVLWIEWEEDVACRKALGRVLKSAWENADRELIHLVLG